MSRVLVTGAGGFVGSHLSCGLAELGYDVVASDRAFDSEAEARLGTIERLTGDVRDLGRRVGDVDFVVHGAAVTADPNEMGVSAITALEENVGLTLAAFQVAAQARASRFVLLSSAGVFGSEQPAPLDESAHPAALGLYAAAKRIGETAAQSLRRSGELDAVSVRLGNLYGSHERSRRTRPRTSLVARLLSEGHDQKTLTLAAPEARREWTWVGDLAIGIAKLLEHPVPPDVTHLCAPETVTDYELAEKLRRFLPGTRVALRPDAALSAVRPPLESRVTSRLGLTSWTSLDEGLRELVHERLPV